MIDSNTTALTPEDYEWGRWLFCQDCIFKLGIQILDQLPPSDMPEVAFAGRSNVGKSSLINALTGRLALARTSNTPGRTQQLNFFELANKLFLVDMPGYGYAKVSKSLVAAWTKVMKMYLRGRPNLQRVYILVDARQGLKESDVDMMNMLDETAVSYQIVLTKIDKISEKEAHALIEGIQEQLRYHGAAHPLVMGTSSQKKIGICELQAEIAKFATQS